MIGTRPLLAVALVALLLGSCGGDGPSITVYSGRTENLIGPLLEQFTAETGIEVAVKYGGSDELALLVSEEGDRSPADVFISQSPGAIGFLADAGRLAAIDSPVLELVEPDYRNAAGLWVGLSGRVRVLVYNTETIDPASLPASVFDLTAPAFAGRLGVAPANGSFQDFVTAMRELQGDAATLEWLEGLEANNAQTYVNNTAIVQAVGRGEVPFGLVNHYYNLRVRAEDPGTSSRNYYFPDGDIGSLLIVTAAGVLNTSEDPDVAAQLVGFLLGESAQTFFSRETLEYPLASGVVAAGELPALATLNVATYDFDRLGGGLGRTKELIDESGLEAP
jgi:iron(III) transport system substrate-binding protein